MLSTKKIYQMSLQISVNFFLISARRLDNDKVPNVLINLIKCYMTLKNTLSVAAKKEWILTAKRLK